MYNKQDKIVQENYSMFFCKIPFFPGCSGYRERRNVIGAFVEELGTWLDNGQWGLGGQGGYLGKTEECDWRMKMEGRDWWMKDSDGE